ncbi:hypothetical protein ACKWMY_27980 [Serratia sp. J2]|uniref:hypothetical protein n=1 Tax=Serratia sp. J2 TaxID=3386551 RepID=UPI003917131D
MAEKEIKIPFSYCRLSRGASFLGVEPSDLINLAVENKIELCIMLKRFHCRVLFKGSTDFASEWHSKLLYPSTFNNLSGQTRAITNYSFIEFSNGEFFNPEKLLSGADVFNEKEGNGFLVGYCFAHGLWRINPEQFESMSVIDKFFPGFYPCLSGRKSPVIQVLPAKPFIDHQDGGRFNFDSFEFSIGVDDLWITHYDIKRIMESDLDFDSLSMLTEVERPDLNGDISNNTNIRSEKALERHARNELAIISAAFRFKDECIDTFKEDCFKKDGSYNFSAWARHVIDKVTLFQNKECPVKSVDTVASYISKVFKGVN